MKISKEELKKYHPQAIELFGDMPERCIDCPAYSEKDGKSYCDGIYELTHNVKEGRPGVYCKLREAMAFVEPDGYVRFFQTEHSHQAQVDAREEYRRKQMEEGT